MDRLFGVTSIASVWYLLLATLIGRPARLVAVRIGHRTDLNPRRYASGDWRLPFASSRFGDFQEASLPNPQVLDSEGLIAFLASMGWIADLPDTTRLPLLRQMRSLLPAAEYRRPWLTRVHWARREADIRIQASECC